MQRGDGNQQPPDGRVARTTPSVTALGAIATSHPGVAQIRMAGRGVPVVTATAALGVVNPGQVVLTTIAGTRTLAMAPQTVMVPAQTVSRLLSPTSLAGSTIQLPAGLNVLQQRLASPGMGVVGVSAVSAQDLQQVLQQAAGQQPITLLTTQSVSDAQRPRLARPISFSLSATTMVPATAFTTTTSGVVSATGATIHHHGQSPVRGVVVTTAPLPHSNLQHSLLGMNVGQQQQQRRLSATAVSTASTTATTLSSPAIQARTVAEVRAPSGQPPSLKTASPASSKGGPPRKKIKIEEKPPPNAEVSNYRRQLLELKHGQMKELKMQYFDNLTELFYLQSGLNFIDFATWKKCPTPQLVNFLKQSKMDSDEEEDVLTVTEINSEVKVLTNPGSTLPVATPVAISTTLPPNVSALSQQVVAPTAQNVSAGSSTTTSPATALASSSQVSGRPQDSKSLVKGGQSPFRARTPSSPSQRLHTRQQSLSQVYDNISGSSQEVIVERAKQEAHVVQRVAELRKEGLWSSKRLPRVQEPPRQKAHWDYLLEEMTWLAADFVQERKWKKAAARKLARMVSNYFKEQEQKEVKAEKEEGIKLKKIASHMAKMVKEFWTNIEKVVQYKQNTRLEEKKKRALDLHLNFIVDQTEKYSSWLTEGLQGGSTHGSVGTSPARSSSGEDFEPDELASDDEETIEKEEEEAEKDEGEDDELEDLLKTGDMPIEELLKTLPQEVLDAPAPLPPPLYDEEGKEEEAEGEEGDKEVKSEEGESKEGSDKEFAGSEDSADEEDTIAEQEKHEKRSYANEIKDLQDEGEMTLEELAAKYAGAYDSDFEMPKESSDEPDSDDEDDDDDDEEEEASDMDTDDFEIETEPSSDEEVEEGEEKEEPGLEALMKTKQASSSSSSATPSSSGTVLAQSQEKDEREEEINDIAAEALRLQPKGYTLETTEVKTKVPPLIKHTLREYQHVGLDWLATMHDKRLNGILADEMGLGKTIQTIALLAHLACEKSIWGPHLIVVPTSVMLNWEMELKKWCPAFKILTYYGNQKERKLKRTGWTKTNAFHVCITSYKLVVQDHQAFRRKKWKYLILDEAQNIKNFKSQRWQMLLNFSSQRRLLLTGTPLQNSLMELWSLMHFLMPNVFQSHRDFKEWFSNPLTGMIEGSQEYNESLIKRLHKVLRPFLLRRLKNEVEKQMPKKFEHVVMCKLSKRQRFLYDDFMAQAKTKETLASGHYMSVINILMQLRKVCNHPNLFDPRPVVSSLCMGGLVYSTASLATRALEKDPLESVDMATLFPNLAEMERDLPAFVAHRVKQLKTPQRLIVDVDSQPEPPPRPPRGQLKPVVFRSISPALQQANRASPLPQARAGSPVAVIRSATPPPTSVPGSAPGVVKLVTQSMLQSVLSSQFPRLQVRTPSGQTLLLTSQPRPGMSSPALVLSSSGATLVTPPASGAATGTAKILSQQATSQPITLQIQQTEQGTRLMFPGTLSQLPPSLLQIVQSSGQVIATSTPISLTSSVATPITAAAGQSSSAVTTTASSTVSSTSEPATVAATSTAGLITTAVSQIRTVPAPPTPSSSTATTTVSSSSSTKPVMRVSPMVVTTAMTTLSVVTTTSCLPASMVSSVVSTLKSVMSPKTVASPPPPPVKRSELFLETVYQRRQQRRQEKLKRLARVNTQHGTLTPVYGPDLVHALTLTSNVASSHGNHWLSAGHANCQCVHAAHNKNLPQYYWHETSHLEQLVMTPVQHLNNLKETLDRFAFVIPTVISPPIQLRVAHPAPSTTVRHKHLIETVHNHLRPVNTLLNDVHMKMSITFPELRLIQYDCGKLQTMDILLRRLKIGSHRVLIFTQMTKMLDVLEAFLNYHGHRYLRLDGTTKVEQRQSLMDRFNADKRIFCFILSTRSGGIGVNLTGADTVIFYDSDWNPTMDAQAQDRCHRIGQTRDVHIYRLISEMTVEENILKKANQKRLLGDLAIEGGNFTTAFFKQQTIEDLFAQPSGLQALAEEKNKLEKEKEEALVIRDRQKDEEMEEDEVATIPEEPLASTSTTTVTPVPATGRKGKDKDSNIIAAFEQALCKAEDESDAIAATLVKAEQKAELAEFDETIPWDEREAEARKEEEEMSRAEMELMMLDKELTPIERYAVGLMESQVEDEVAEELKMAEEDIENSKKEWELTRLKALKEEEERRAELEDDEMLYTYLRDDAQVFINCLDGADMPMWSPPTPPSDDNDVYLDPTLMFLYEGHVMPESQLPPVYVRKEHKKPRVETITTRKQKQRKEEAMRIPRSLFDRPSAAILKQRREQKYARQNVLFSKQHMGMHMRPPPIPAKPIEQSEGHPEWLIHEDWALLSAVQELNKLPLNLHVQQNAHQPNWDLVAEVVNMVSRTFRSVKQCKARYENTIIPREEGKLLYDISPRKQKKQKTSYKTKNNRPMKTCQLMSQDNNNSVTLLYSLRFDSIKAIAAKRPPSSRPAVQNPMGKNPKHMAVLQDFNINFDQPLNPIQVAANRAERIAREKKNAAAQQSQAAAEAAQRQTAQTPGSTAQPTTPQAVVQAVTGVAASAPTVAQAVAGTTQLHSLVPVSGTPTTIIHTAGTARAVVGQGLTAVTIARTVAPGNIVVTGGRGISQRVAVHDIATVAGSVAAAQVAAGQAQARTTIQPSGSATASATLSQKMAAIAGTSALTGLTAKGLTHQQINLLRPIMRSQAPGTATQAQQLRAAQGKLSFTKQGALVRHPFTDEQLKSAFKVRQLQNKGQAGQQVQLQAAQILQGQMQAVGQSGTISQAPVTLVKSVAAPAGTSAVPIPVSINVTMGQGQQKAGVPASRGATVNQLQQQRMLLQQRKGLPLQQPQRVTALSGVRGGQIPLIIPQKGQLTGQLLHQIVKQGHMTSQPAIISVTQGQPLTPMVAKVSLTTGPHASSIQTLTTVSGTPITVTQVGRVASAVASAPSGTPQSVATISMSPAVTQATVVKTATLVDPTATKVSAISHSLVGQPLQVVSSALAQQQAQGQALVAAAGGMQHRVYTATPTSIPQGTAVVITTSALTAATTIIQQAISAASAASSVVHTPSPSAVVSAVITQTQPTAGQSAVAQSATQQQQQQAAQQQQQQQASQKASPYAMRTRTQSKH